MTEGGGAEAGRVDRLMMVAGSTAYMIPQELRLRGYKIDGFYTSLDRTQERRSNLSLTMRPRLPDRSELEKDMRELDRKLEESDRRLEELRQMTVVQERLAAERREQEERERERAVQERVRSLRTLREMYHLMLIIGPDPASYETVPLREPSKNPTVQKLQAQCRRDQERWRELDRGRMERSMRMIGWLDEELRHLQQRVPERRVPERSSLPDHLEAQLHAQERVRLQEAQRVREELVRREREQSSQADHLEAQPVDQERVWLQEEAQRVREELVRREREQSEEDRTTEVDHLKQKQRIEKVDELQGEKEGMREMEMKSEVAAEEERDDEKEYDNSESDTDSDDVWMDEEEKEVILAARKKQREEREKMQAELNKEEDGKRGVATLSEEMEKDEAEKLQEESNGVRKEEMERNVVEVVKLGGASEMWVWMSSDEEDGNSLK
ncbi:golgin subfamily A member 6-like protein 22 [Alosa alosa]|uniref:golgin subfamily A member 6-like protein 22 n=1 Tax=Alosa alosa TaxID=278164 RepID=UPI0020150D16|nr:golgin subfamily A member 6-like protein 22 [Alosa alosa]